MKIKDLIAMLKDKYGIEYYDSKKLIKYCLNVDDNFIIINNDKEIEDVIKNININNNKILNQNSQSIVEQIENLANEIKNGKPIQYITKEQYFMGYSFYVDERVLIPQPDTEILVEAAIKKIKEMLKNFDNNKEKTLTNKKIKLLDLCTGSGAIGISIKKLLGENIEVTLSDISNDSLDVAKLNSEKIGVKCNFIQSDMFENINEKFDIIVSNPPYIKTDIIEKLDNDVKNEPHIALDGGRDGLKFYKIIKSKLSKCLKENGYLILEIGYDQKEDVQNLFKNTTCIKDYSGKDRVIVYKFCNY